MITKLFQALSKTRNGIAGAFNTLIKQRVTPETLEMLEDTLITADLGIHTTSGIIKVVEQTQQNILLMLCANICSQFYRKRFMNYQIYLMCF